MGILFGASLLLLLLFDKQGNFFEYLTMYFGMRSPLFSHTPSYYRKKSLEDDPKMLARCLILFSIIGK